MELKELVSRFRDGLAFTHPNSSTQSSDSSGSWNVGQAKRIYHSLPPNCIRLVRLEPSNTPDAQIVLHTEVVSLTHPPGFEALSYVWGMLEPLVQVTCNGVHIHITPNLALALLRMRRPIKDGVRKLWIDAVCINQDDQSERSSQVMMMKDIYAKASCVLIWLGEMDHNNELFAAAGKQISALAKFLRNGSRTLTPSLHQISAILKQSDNNTTFEFRKWIENPTNWHFIQTVIDSTWFSRVWIIQEFAQAKDIQILTGENILPSFDLFLCALYVRKNHYSLAPPEEEPLDHIIRIYNMRFKNHLLPQIEATSMFQASNPRDKIYAVIGLPSVEQERNFDARSLLRPDYRKEVWEVYGNVVRHFIRLPRERTYHPLGEEPVGGQKYGEGVLDILRPPERHELLEDKEKEVSAKTWPSWVPRWDLIDDTYRHPPGIWAVDPKFLWRPAGDLNVDYLPPKKESANKILELKGVKVGVVEAIFDHVLQPYSPTQRNSKYCVKKLLKHFEEHFSFHLNQPSVAYRGPGSVKADFAEVITAGSLTELSPKDSTSSIETLRRVAGTEGLVMQEWLGISAGSNSSSEDFFHRRSPTGSSKASSKKSFEDEFNMWLEWEGRHATLKREKSLSEDSVLARFGSQVDLNRTFFVTKNGKIGVGSPKIRVGDEIWMLYGGRCLYVVRKGVETVNVEIAQVNAVVALEAEECRDNTGQKKGGLFGMGRRRSRDPGESPKKAGFMGMGATPKSRSGSGSLAGSPTKGGIFGMGRRISQDTEQGIPTTIPRPLSGETVVTFDSTPGSPSKGSIYGRGGRQTSIGSGKFGKLMGRKSREELRENISNSTTPRPRSPHNFNVYRGISPQTRLFVGEAFVSGYMDSEAVSEVTNGKLYENWLVLI